ncbi:hypothetical protein [Vineibacter terrae]|uniref:hypothetical protein n=1 Tax=Vineibacter terrae TaxID=2586908 RepID=UPI0015B4F172|nr:hypothetical protein [Vineibacter terrae]
MANEIILAMADLRDVTAFAAENAADALEIFERSHPSDTVLGMRSTPRGRLRAGAGA